MTIVNYTMTMLLCFVVGEGNRPRCFQLAITFNTVFLQKQLYVVCSSDSIVKLVARPSAVLSNNSERLKKTCPMQILTSSGVKQQPIL